MSRSSLYRCARLADCREDIASLRTRSPVVLVGSFISTYAPTSLPSGIAVCDSLWRLLFGTHWPTWLEADFWRMPFESLIQCYPDRPSISCIVRRLFAAHTPNPVHRALADGLASGTLSSVITTNYDCALEACGPGFVPITTEADYDSWRQTTPAACFKIHGTATEGLEGSLVCDLASEGRLPVWKRELLHTLIAERTVIILGYSGRDFDICPELADAHVPLDLVWLQRSRRDLVPNAVRALERRKGLLVLGDLVEFLTTLLDQPLNAERVPVTWDARPHFPNDVIVEWRSNILDWMACATLLRSTPAPHDDIARIRREAALGGHTGRYRDAARAFERANKVASVLRQERLGFQLQSAGAWFIYGRYHRAWRYLRTVERSLQRSGDQDLLLTTLELRMIMYMRLAQLARLLRSSRLLTHAQDQSRPAYETARPLLEALGAWGRLAALRQNAERIGIAVEKDLALPAAQGYSSLGQPAMDVITKRDWLRTGTMTSVKERVGRSCITKAERYGWDHEAWKFHWILLCRGTERHRMRHFAGWCRHFWKTQYPPLGRLFQLWNNTPE